VVCPPTPDESSASGCHMALAGRSAVPYNGIDSSTKYGMLRPAYPPDIVVTVKRLSSFGG